MMRRWVADNWRRAALTLIVIRQKPRGSQALLVVLVALVGILIWQFTEGVIVAIHDPRLFPSLLGIVLVAYYAFKVVQLDNRTHRLEKRVAKLEALINLAAVAGEEQQRQLELLQETEGHGL